MGAEAPVRGGPLYVSRGYISSSVYLFRIFTLVFGFGSWTVSSLSVDPQDRTCKAQYVYLHPPQKISQQPPRNTHTVRIYYLFTYMTMDGSKFACVKTDTMIVSVTHSLTNHLK